MNANDRKPNILFVFSDMQRADTLGCYGNGEVKTPNFDRIAQEGARFDSAISCTPVCCPSRASIMTGLYAHKHRVLSNSAPFKRTQKPLAEIFSDAGYLTAYLGKWHIPATTKKDLGFRNLDPKYKPNKGHMVARPDLPNKKPIYLPRLLTDRAIRFLKNPERVKTPWVLFVSWLPPHTPYKAPGKWAERHRKNGVNVPANVPAGEATDYAKRNLPEYYGMVESLDHQFSRILEALEQTGQKDNTIVVFTSDHGDQVGSQGLKFKRFPYEESIRVPFVVSWPGRIDPGTVVETPFGTPDILPTLMGLAGVSSEQTFDGRDRSSILRGGDDAADDATYISMPYGYVPWPGWKGVRTKRYSYARLIDRPWLLFDLEADPLQMTNLVDAPDYAAVRAELDGLLTSIMAEIGDSWEEAATDGDLKKWTPGGEKTAHQTLGGVFPS